MDPKNSRKVNETRQDHRKNIFLICGIILGLVVLVLGVNSLALNFFGIGFTVLLSIFLLKKIVEAYLRLFEIPQKMSVHDNGIVIQRHFHNDIIVDINEIERMEYSRLVSLFVSGSGYLECKDRSMRLYISKPLLHNFEDFILVLQQVKPHLIIDERLI